MASAHHKHNASRARYVNRSGSARTLQPRTYSLDARGRTASFHFSARRRVCLHRQLVSGQRKKNKTNVSTNHGQLLSVLSARPTYYPGPVTSLTNPLSKPISCDSLSALSSQPTAASDTSHLHQYRHRQFPPSQEASTSNTISVYANLHTGSCPQCAASCRGLQRPKVYFPCTGKTKQLNLFKHSCSSLSVCL